MEKKYIHSGFTVVELLIVICVSCIAATLLLPAFQNAVSRGRLDACSNNQRNIGTALIVYCFDNCGFIPNLADGMEKYSTPVIRMPGGTVFALGRLLKQRYIDNAECFGCPDSPGCDGMSVKKLWSSDDEIVWSGYLYRSQDTGFIPQLNAPENLRKAILMDFACRSQTGEDVSPHKYRFSNLLYPDNHVECRRNSAEPYTLYTASVAGQRKITPECTALWQNADR